MQKIEYEVITNNNVDLKKSRWDKMISYYSDYLSMKTDTSYVIYYELPINSIYWTIGFYNSEGCLESVNMGKYKTTEKGDILAILVGNNLEALDAAKNETIKKHNIKFPYKKLIFHNVKMNSNFYIHFESYSNKFIHHEIHLKIKRYIFDKLNYQFLNGKIHIESEERKCENIKYFNAIKEDIIHSYKQKFNVMINTNENNSTTECFTNKSEIIENDGKFKIIAVDHFKSKASLHSHLMFYNADTDIPFKVEITGELSDRLNNKFEISVRNITPDIPENIKRFYILERIYNDFVTSGKIHEGTIIPMEIYKC